MTTGQHFGWKACHAKHMAYNCHAKHMAYNCHAKHMSYNCHAKHMAYNTYSAYFRTPKLLLMGKRRRSMCSPVTKADEAPHVIEAQSRPKAGCFFGAPVARGPRRASCCRGCAAAHGLFQGQWLECVLLLLPAGPQPGRQTGTRAAAGRSAGCCGSGGAQQREASQSGVHCRAALSRHRSQGRVLQH